MAFNNPASKFERALRAYLIAQGKATAANTFVANDSRARNVLPNRTIQATSFNPRYGHRPEGEVQFNIQHHAEALEQGADVGTDIQRVNMDKFLGDTMDSMAVGDAQSFNLLADAITTAGRALAVSDGSQAGDAQAAINADMVNFRCDWVKNGHPLLTRGHPDGNAVLWVEILNFSAFVSAANAAQEV